MPRPVRSAISARSTAQTEPRPDVSLIRASAINMSFGGLAALADVTFELEKGDSIGLVGANGSGKTTLLNVLSGIYQPQAGSLTVGDVSVLGRAPWQIAALGIGRTFQHPALPENLTVAEAAMLGADRNGKSSLISYAFGLPFINGQERSLRTAALGALELVGLLDFRDVRLRELPYGLLKKVDLARALAGSPAVVLLDEPAAGLNDDERESLVNVLHEVRDGLGLGLVVVEHSLEWIRRLCPRVVALSAGQVVFVGDVDSFAQHSSAEAIFALDRSAYEP
jgi:ABC-type branched-subunit amino acid transport system ATPase component